MSLSKPTGDLTPLLVSERLIDILSQGSLSGFITTSILYPIENIRTRMQQIKKQQKLTVEERQNLEEMANSEKGKASIKDKHISFIKEMQNVLKKEGIEGFYKGFGLYVIGIIASFGTFFLWYEFFKDFFLKKGFSTMGYAKTSIIAGLICATVVNPIWLTHSEIIREKGSKSILETIQSIYSKHGIQGFFKGLGAGYILVLNPLIQFVIYENLKKKFGKSKHQNLMIFLAGAFSKLISTIATYPYQTIKTNMYIHRDKGVTQLSMIKEILDQRGPLGFFSGIEAKLLQTIINSALMLLIHERLHVGVKKLLVSILSK